jgi:hypothetical protein
MVPASRVIQYFRRILRCRFELGAIVTVAETQTLYDDLLQCAALQRRQDQHPGAIITAQT